MSDEKPDEKPKVERRTFGTLKQFDGIWWIRYRVDGKERWESLKTKNRKKAEDAAAVIGDRVGRGEHTPGEVRRVTFKNLEALLKAEAKKDGLRSLPRIERALTHLRETFGTSRAMAITSERIVNYELARMEAGAARATVNYEASVLRRMFYIALEKKKVLAVPAITISDPKNERSGFFKPDDVEALLQELPSYLRPVMQFTRYTGWRCASEVLPLEWSHVDRDAGVVWLDANTTKTGEPRRFPYAKLSALKAVIDEQWAAKQTHEKATGEIVRHVFHRDGRQIRSYKSAWMKACDRAAHGGKVAKPGEVRVLVRPALVGALVHDFRRGAVRDLVRAGVDRKTAKRLTGHITDSVFDRYDIGNDDDLAAGVDKLEAHLNPSPKAPQSSQDAPESTKGTPGGPQAIRLVGND